ncbi:MAG: DUF4173 domain-containing protein, partial [Chloroflexaceae bacterium]|nr:DUF4173 domain-containing protein [Chloroflexaceae bacterium]
MNITLAHPRRLLLAALVLGVLANLLFYGQMALGISMVLFVGAGLALLGFLSLREQRPPSRANLWLGAAALLFAAFVALRDSALLLFLNLLAVGGLLWLLAASYRSQSLAKLTLVQTLANLLVALLEICVRAIPLGLASAKGLNIKQTQMGRFVPLLRGLLLATPIVLVFTALLAAADSVFSSYVTDLFRFEIPFDTSDLVGRFMFTGFVAWLCAGGLLAALDAHMPREPRPAERPAEGVTQPLTPPAPLLRLGMVESLTVLLAVDLLFFVFMLVQGAYFFGGLDTLQRTGMTYADYARRG